MKHWLAPLLFLWCACCTAQNKTTDLQLITRHVTGEPGLKDTLNSRSALHTKHHNVFARYNPVTLGLAGLMLFYQHAVSPQISSACIYTRSCSNFSKQAIAEYGIIKGVFLTADRLMRCNHQCEEDFPGYLFTEDGRIIDEPSVYKRR